MPSSATSQPARLDLAAFGEPSIRIGLVLLMWIVDAPAAKPVERRERAVRAVDRHVAHAAAGLVAGAGRDHLVVGEQRAVEQDDVGAGEPLAQRRRHRGGARARRRSRRVAAAISTPTLAPVSAASCGCLALEIERHLAGHREQLA